MGKTIERTIGSVIRQTYANIEYIVIDGASTDETIEKIRKYEGRIQHWVSEPDEGISDAFNKGIRLSEGELIGIISGDDWFEIDAVEKVVGVFLRDPSVGVIHGKCRMYEKGKALFVKNSTDIISGLWVSMVLNHPTCFVKRECYEKYGTFLTNYKAAMDYELMLRFLSKGVRFKYIEETLANYSFGGYSDRFEIDELKEVIKLHREYGYSKYFCQFWLSLGLRLCKRSVRRLLGRDHVLLRKVRSVYRQTSGL